MRDARRAGGALGGTRVATSHAMPALEPATHRPLSRVERLNLLGDRPVCCGLSPETLDDVNAAFELRHVAAGVRVVHRGESRVPFILVAHGGLRASYVEPV